MKSKLNQTTSRPIVTQIYIYLIRANSNLKKGKKRKTDRPEPSFGHTGQGGSSLVAVGKMMYKLSDVKIYTATQTWQVSS